MNAAVKETLVNDYSISTSSPKMVEKKALAAKYNAASNKAGDIQKAILIAFRDLRNTQTSFTEDDIVWYNRLDNPEQYKKLEACLKLESMDFIKYMVSFFENKLKTKTTRGGRTLFEIKDWSLGRDWNYYMSWSDRYLITRYNNLVKFITDNTTVKVETPESKLKEVMMSELKEFHDNYILNVKNQSTSYYEKLPSIIAEVKITLEAKKKEYYNLNSKACNMYNTHNRGEEYNTLRLKEKEAYKAYEKICSSYKRLNYIVTKFKTLEEYVNYQIAEAEKKFESNVDAVVSRIKDRNFNLESTKITHAANDPKFLEMIITDGVQKVYCRSVLAAEYSEKMIAHFRFIITNR